MIKIGSFTATIEIFAVNAEEFVAFTIIIKCNCCLKYLCEYGEDQLSYSVTNIKDHYFTK
jgi:hypothetical protein